MIVLNVCILIIIFFTTFHFKNVFSDFDKNEKRFLNKLFFYHFLIAVIFHFYIETYGGDAIHYWEFSKNSSFAELFELLKQGSASAVIFLMNYVLAKVLGLSFFVGNMMYASLGYFGFVYFYRILKGLLGTHAIQSKAKLFGIPMVPWIWFLPNLHFWSSGIGKDTILFFSVSIFVYALIRIRRRLPLLGLALFLSLAVRPHITLFLFVAFGIGYVLDGKLNGYQKVLIFIIAIVGFTSIFGYVMEFIQLESLETSVIEEYTSKKSASLNKATAGSGIDISGYPFIFKFFTFLYRPLFFDSNGILGMVASVENFLLLSLTVSVFRRKFVFIMKKTNFILKGILIYFLLGSIAFSLILGNLGIMLRQKNMFIPLFLILILVINITTEKSKRELSTRTHEA